MGTMKPSRLPALLLSCATLAGCAQPATAPAIPASTPEPESARLTRELHALIGPAACNADSQCRSLPVGAKACGGPAGFLAWSTAGTDAARLQDLATRQAEAQRREIETSGLRSNCAVSTDPGAACVAGRCQLRASASVR